MSKLIYGADGIMTYVVGCEREKNLLAAFPTIGKACKGLDTLQAAGRDSLVLHNITHPKCPEWIMKIVREDPEYCARRASHFQKSAAGKRRQADELVAEAERLEELASKWLSNKEFAALSAPPGM